MKIKIGLLILAIFASVVVLYVLYNTKNNTTTKNISVVHYKPLWETEKNDDKKYLYGIDIKQMYDTEGSMYVFDYKEKAIRKYGVEGDYIKKFGTIGQGPGEFVLPKCFCVDKNGFVYVADIGKRKIEIFDKKGSVYTSFYIKPTYESATVLAKNMDTIYVATTKEDKIITAYNYKGEELFSFCDAKKEKTKFAQTFSNVVYMSYDDYGNIWVAYRAFPIIRKYTPKGELIFEKELTSENITKTRIDEKNNSYSKQTSFYYYLSDIIDANNYMYVSSNSEIMEIEMKSGDIKRIFQTSKERKDSAKSFNTLSFNKITGKFVFASGGILYTITDGI